MFVFFCGNWFRFYPENGRMMAAEVRELPLSDVIEIDYPLEGCDPYGSRRLAFDDAITTVAAGC